MQNSTLNGADGICAFLNLSSSKTGNVAARANLSQQLGAVLDINATWAERTLINPVVRQYQMARCNHQFELTRQAMYNQNPLPGALSPVWTQNFGSGILACISICLNISLIVVTIRQIKEYKVCNWLLAFDALCQFFTMATFLVNFFAILFGVSALDFRVCMASLFASVMGMHSSVLTIYLISLERMLLTLASMRMSLLVTPSKVRRWSLVAMCLGTVFGLYMSSVLLLYINVLIQFSISIYGVMCCGIGVYIYAINQSPICYILLLLSLLNYAIIFAFLTWRYFLGATSGESVRRVLRALFILSLVVLVGWLVSVTFNWILFYLYMLLDWLFHLFGTDPTKSRNLFYGIYETQQSILHWIGIVASAGGAPVLYWSSTEYRNAYRKMFGRTSVMPTNAAGPPPLFIQRRNENGIITQAARDTTVVS